MQRTGFLGARLAILSLTVGVLSHASAEDLASKSERLFQETQVHMGSKFTIVLYARSEPQARAAYEKAFQRIHELDLVMSDYLDESELNRLSAASPTSQPIPVSNDLWPALVQAQEVSDWSAGAFDITVGPLTTLWRRAKREKKLPSSETLIAAMARVGYRKIELDETRHTIQLHGTQMRLDLGGIGQGYAADQALQVLRECGLPRALVNASGDLAVGEPPPGESGWKVVFPGLNDSGQAEPQSMLVCRQAISTSGDAFQFVEIEGVRYSHIVDPQTGLGVTESRSVTVLAKNCILADSLATAFCVLTPTKAIALANRLQIAVQLIRQSPTGPLITRSIHWPTKAH